MNAGQSQERSLFEAALQLKGDAERKAFLDVACASDPDLRRRIDELLAAASEADAFFREDPLKQASLEKPASAPTMAVPQPTLAEGPGTVIDKYKLLEKLGEGGFGVVYMAEQREPVKRRVALKIIKVGMDTREVVARFEAERQALALMDHPNIAKVFDAGGTGAEVVGQASRLCTQGHLAPESVNTGEAPGETPAAKTGETPVPLSAGRPYFVMELVRGIKITEYCDQHSLSTRERLDLFVQVCQAVQHAHQKGIIHRDIKPSNILVTVNDGVAVPKIIDFGIAKATQMELTEKTVFTRFHQFLGTPAYMSPEQAELTSVDVDTRSDIYSLGVLLYELLTGKTPFDANELLKAGLDEMRRTIREVEPPKPSTRLTQELLRMQRPLTPSLSPGGGEGARRADEGECRGTVIARPQQTKELIHLLRGDLDWIVMKCLEKDRARRYETANGLASDIHRHLHNEPVVARPPSNLYRFQKMVRRNKVFFAAGTCVATALVLGLCTATWALLREREARQRAVAAEQAETRQRQQAQANERNARTAAAKSRQTLQFLEDMLAGAGPEVAKGRDATILKEIVDKTAQRISDELTNQPVVEADIRSSVGKVYTALGDYEAAERMQRRVVALERELHPEGHRDVAWALYQLAVTLFLRGQLPESETLSREAVELGKKFPGPFPADPAAWMNNLATTLKHENKLAEAEALYREALALNRKLLGNEHREVAVTINNLALVLAAQDKFDEAEPLLREAIERCRKLFGNEHPLVARGLTSLSKLLDHQGKYEAAETTGREALALEKQLKGPEHPDVADTLANVAEALEHQGKLQEAGARYREALAIRRKALGNNHPLVAQSLELLGLLLHRQDKLAEAEAALRESLAITLQVPRNDFVKPETLLGDLAKVLAAEGNSAEAQALLKKAQDIRKETK